MAKREPSRWEEVAAEHADATLEERMLHVALSALEPVDEDTAEEAAELSESLPLFVRKFWPVLEPDNAIVWGWHLDCICEHLEYMTAGHMADLVINMPPRHAKSLIVSVFWFCWVWTTTPSSRWLFSSYSDSLATRDSGKCLDVIRSAEYQRLYGGAFRLRSGQKAMSRFSNNRTGYRISTSVMGKGMGEGGDYVVVDDPHKPTEVNSDVLRERVNDWWAGTMTARGNNPATARHVVVMQRLHERDLSGHLLASEMGYEHLCLPAEYEPKRYFFPTPEQPKPREKIRDVIVPTKLQRQRPELLDPRKEEGELLWPERFDREALAKLKKGLATGAAGQLGQRPAPEQGDFFARRTFRYCVEEQVRMRGPDGRDALVPCYTLMPAGRDNPVHIPTEHCRLFATADTALRAGDRNSFTVATVFASCPVLFQGTVLARYLLILEVYREHLTVPQQYPFLRQIRQRHPGLMFLGIEPKASGIGLIQQSVIDGDPFKQLSVQGDKIQRAAAVVQLYQDGLVFHRQAMQGLTDLEDEMLTFPSGANDDIVDTVAYGGICFSEERLLTAAVDRDLVIYDGQGERGGETYSVGGVDVHFPEEDESWWDR